jgi:hypothetical protein
MTNVYLNCVVVFLLSVVVIYACIRTAGKSSPKLPEVPESAEFTFDGDFNDDTAFGAASDASDESDELNRAKPTHVDNDDADDGGGGEEEEIEFNFDQVQEFGDSDDEVCCYGWWWCCCCG